MAVIHHRCAFETIQLEILDNNEFAPVFADSVTTAKVAENAPVGYIVATIKATDYDEIDTPALTLNEVCVSLLVDYHIPSRNASQIVVDSLVINDY